MIDMTIPRATTTVPDPSLVGESLGLLRRLLRQTFYVLVGFPLAVAAFVAVVAGLSLGIGLLITLAGIPVLVVTLLAAQVFAAIERVQLTRVLGRSATPVRYRRGQPGDGLLRRALRPLADPQRWLDVLHALISLPLAAVAFAVVVGWWAAAIGGTTSGLLGWLIPDGPEDQGLVGIGGSGQAEASFDLVVGLIALMTLPLVVGLVARVRALLGEALLFGLAGQQRQIDTLVAGRDAGREAEEDTRRRLERDIHDGPQQRLVRLSMDLGRAQLKAGEAPSEVRAAIDDAKRQVQDTLDELRALSRGIAPPALVDRGLQRAVEDLAARFTVPVRTDLRLGDTRFAPHIESALYFAVSEALANVAKHSDASEVTIHLEVDDGVLRATVHDDGGGGAHLAKGHGLAGLEQRMRSVDGTLVVISPSGGPTIVVAEVPCGPMPAPADPGAR